MSTITFSWSKPGKATPADDRFGDCCGLRPLIITWPRQKFLMGVECQNPECENSQGVLACDVDIVEKWEKCRKELKTVQCPYCGNDELDKFIGEAEGYVTCLACNGEFEEGEVEYYEAQSEEEQPPDLFPETATRLGDLSKTLKWLRKMRNLTLKEAAELSGLSHSYISDIERERTTPSLKTVQKLTEAYRSPLSVHFSLAPLQSASNDLDDRYLRFNSIMQILNNDIKWHKDNPDMAPNPEFGKGFIRGIEQAIYLIIELSEIEEGELPDTLIDEPDDSIPGVPGWMGDYGATPFGPVDI